MPSLAWTAAVPPPDKAAVVRQRARLRDPHKPAATKHHTREGVHRRHALGTGAGDCAACTPLVTAVPAFGATFGAQPSTPTTCGVDDTLAAWHCWIPDCTGTAVLSLCGATDFASTLAVFAACDGPELACSAAPTCSLAPEVMVDVEAGVPLVVRVAGVGGGSGSYELLATCMESPTPCPDTAAACCTAHPGGGCADADCCSTVCAINSSCCTAAWTPACAALADEHCVACGGGIAGCVDAGGFCCVSHGSPGCSDPACCNTVCTADPFCCQATWDGLCADQAIAACAICDLPPEPHDACADAIPLESGTTPFGNVGATTDGPPEPNCNGLADDVESDVWYDYIAPCSGRLDIDTCGSGFDTVLAVYDGCGCPPGASAACDDDDCGPTLQSRVTVDDVVAGQCYKVRVGSFNANQRGIGQLHVACTPEYAACDDSSGACCAGHAGAGCAEATCCATVCGIDPACCTDSWTKDCATLAAELCGVCGGGDGDDCGGCLAVQTAVPFAGSTIGATGGPPSMCAAGTDPVDRWHCWASDCDGLATFSLCGATAFDSTLQVRAGACDGPVVACDDDACAPFGPSRVAVPVMSANTYYIRVAGFGGATGDYTLNISCDSEQPACAADAGDCCTRHDGPGCGDVACCETVCDLDPACCAAPWDPACAALAQQLCAVCGGGDGDDCAGCLPLSTAVPAEGSTIGFSGADVSSCAQNDAFDAWHCWTATCTGGALFSLCEGTAYDATLAVYEGGCAGAEIGCNDDACAAFGPAEWLAPVVAGTPYAVRVSGYNGATGDYTLQVDCSGLSNDDCAQAEALSAGAVSIDTTLATGVGPNLPAACNEGFGTVIAADVWFDYVAPACGTVTLGTCGTAQFDTRLAVYAGCGCPVTNDRLVACNDDADGCPAYSSEVAFEATQNTCYKVRVGGFGGASGLATLTLSEEPAPCPGCPPAPIAWLDPPSGVVDARQPHPVGAVTPLQGIDRLSVTAPAGTTVDCWSLCETAAWGPPNAVVGVSDYPNGVTELLLLRPITAGATTTVTYSGAPSPVLTLTAHPGNVNGDTGASPLDLLALIDVLNGIQTPRWGVYSTDIDHSGTIGPLDLLAVVDLLNGADAHAVWNGTPLPAPSCP